MVLRVTLGVLFLFLSVQAKASLEVALMPAYSYEKFDGVAATQGLSLRSKSTYFTNQNLSHGIHVIGDHYHPLLSYWQVGYGLRYGKKFRFEVAGAFVYDPLFGTGYGGSVAIEYVLDQELFLTLPVVFSINGSLRLEYLPMIGWRF